MATKKITDLTLQSAGNVVPANDVLPIVDIANNETKRITIDVLASALGAVTATSASFTNNVTVTGAITAAATSASLTTSASNAAITFDNLPTSIADARQIGSGSLFVSGSTVNAGATALFVFTG
tara:strand:+ start:212 stop:583 length:372 start_codon:yes stop_codon:yes gene_type:complete